MSTKTVTGIVFLVLLVAGGVILWHWGSEYRGLVPLVTPAPELPTGEPLPFAAPEGFAVHLFARDLAGARVLVHEPTGGFLLSQTSEGQVVHVLSDGDQDGMSDGTEIVLDGLNNPHGLAFNCPQDGEECTLYVAEEDAVRAYDYDSSTHSATNSRVVAELPAGGGHYTRSLLMHPDGQRLLISVGSSCNVCNEEDPRRATVLQLNLSNGEVSTFATGLRNTVFMETHYGTGDIWGTDMGRDHLGDNLPSDEINILREGAWYGWPWFYGKNVEDFNFSPNVRPSFAQEPVPSHIDLQAHSAPLGLVFVPEEGWPEEYWYDALVAYHGSWNRSEPTGYKVVRIPLDAEGSPEGEPVDFLTGFRTEDGTVLGRPVGLLIEPGGVLYVTDDRAGAVYRVTRTELP